MMTAMISLAALTHAAPAPEFNGLFYATAATVIPVLYIALAVQGHAGASLAHAAVRIRTGGPAPMIFWRFATSQILGFLASLIITGGAIAEASAIWVLYEGRSEGNLGPVILGATIFLTVATAAGPAREYLHPPRQPAATHEEHT